MLKAAKNSVPKVQISAFRLLFGGKLKIELKTPLPPLKDYKV
jgi:hypothetical protein